jgi:hypothetical protein
VALDAAGDQTFQHVGQIRQRIDTMQLCCLCRVPNYAEALHPTLPCL